MKIDVYIFGDFFPLFRAVCRYGLGSARTTTQERVAYAYLDPIDFVNRIAQTARNAATVMNIAAADYPPCCIKYEVRNL